MQRLIILCLSISLFIGGCTTSTSNTNFDEISTEQPTIQTDEELSQPTIGTELPTSTDEEIISQPATESQ